MSTEERGDPMSNPTDRNLRAEREQRIERVLGPARASQLPIRDFGKLYTLVGDLVDDAERLRGEVARLTNELAETNISWATDAAFANKQSAEVARLQSERDAAKLINEQLLQGNVDPVDVIAAIVNECLAVRAEVTAAKADAAEAIRLIVVKNYTEGSELVDDLGDYDRGVADAELDISAYRDEMRAADTRAELGDS